MFPPSLSIPALKERYPEALAGFIDSMLALKKALTPYLERWQNKFRTDLMV